MTDTVFRDNHSVKPNDLIKQVANSMAKKCRAASKRADDLTLLQDRDGDRSYKEKTVFAENLNAPCAWRWSETNSTWRTRMQ